MRVRGRQTGGALARVVAVNALLTVLLLGGIEAGVRLMHPEIGPVGSDRRLLRPGAFGATDGLQPGAEGRSGGALFRVDARGHWVYAGNAAADTAGAGWLFLGDSVTMGSGVAPDATFAGRVAAAQDSLAVWNPSLIGYESDDYLRVLAAHLARGGVRRVSVFWCLNDVYAGQPVAGAPAGPRVLESRAMGFVRQHVYTYQWLKATLFDRPRTYYDHDRRYYHPGSPHLRTAVAHLRRMAAWCRARGIPFEVLLLPYAYQVRTGDFGPQAVLARALHAAGVPVRDLAPALRAAGPAEALYLYGDGIHLSAEGHRAVAGALLRTPAP